jgi:hypothetical protein
MSSKPVKDAVTGYLKTNWVATEVKEIENIFVDNPGEEEWVGLQFPGAVEYAAALSNNCFREEGSFSIGLFGISGAGTDSLDTLGVTMMGLFRGQAIDGVIIDMVTTPSYREDEDRQENESGNAYTYVISVDYHYDVYPNA